MLDNVFEVYADVCNLPTTRAIVSTTSIIMLGTGIRLSLQREFRFLEEPAAHFLVIR